MSEEANNKSDTHKKGFPPEIHRGTKEAMLFSLERSNGIVQTACINSGISRDTHYRWLRDDPQYNEAVMMAKDIAIDFVESKLMALINGVTVEGKFGTVYKRAPDVASVIFYLKTQAKHRGYVERVENINTDLVVEIEGRTIVVERGEG
jgi:hypothetical protein